MLSRSGVAIAVAVGVCLAAPTPAFAAADRRGYASLNGLDMYYEVHGAGRPLVLLHGALMTIEGMGAATALQVAIRHPDLVRKLVIAAPAYRARHSID
jgi:pimeloyl-ACP methyl ester carboxylesterase